MERKFALFFAIAITLLIAINASIFSTQFSPEREEVKIQRIIDGDTLELEDSRKIRLSNINTPEKNIPGSELATAYLKQYEDKIVEIEITGSDKYGRVLARIFVPDYLNLELVKRGLAVKYLVKEEEKKLFAEAEESAIKSSLGIWKKSPYYNCLESFISEKEEIVTISNKCNKLNIASWILKDESRKLYVFKEIELGVIKLHTEQGEDNETDIFWNSKSDIWNNDRDTLYMYDKDWQIIHYNSYGY